MPVDRVRSAAVSGPGGCQAEAGCGEPEIEVSLLLVVPGLREIGMDPWDSRQLLREFLQLLPLLAIFVLGGLFALAVALAAVKRARKKWDAEFLSRYKEAPRREIQERDP